jgi:septal ring factor EnvC (AmiA/AmiB activator)
MPLGSKTQYLIASYKRSIAQDLEQKKQLDQTISGLIIQTDSNSDPQYILEGVNEQILKFNPSINGLDHKILELNTNIQKLQSQIIGLGVSANLFGCPGIITGITTITRDDITLHSWQFTSPNPFSKTTQLLTSNTIGIGTYNQISSTVAIGTYYTFDTDIICTGYAASISTLENQITPLQTQRNSLITQVNLLKEARSSWELQRYSYQTAKMQLDAQISKKSEIISVFENSNNQQYFFE